MPLRPSLVKVALLLASAPAALAAQQPDTTRPLVIFNGSLRPGAPQFVVLTGGYPYIIEVEGGARFAIRSRRTMTPVNLSLPARSQEAQAAGSDRYVIVPPMSDEYRVEVIGTNTDVWVRIIRDPHEARIYGGHAVPPRGRISVGVRTVAWVTGLTAVYGSAGGFATDSVVESGGFGVEGCLGIAPGQLREMPRLTGCLFSAGIVTQPDGARFTFWSANPEFVMTVPGASPQLAVSALLGFGQAGAPYRTDIGYLFAGGGASFAWTFGGRLTLELSPALVLVQRDDYTTQFNGAIVTHAGAVTVAPRVTAGVRLRL